MNLTSEQQLILETNEDIRVNAAAGTGKTTTLLQYAKTRSSKSKILYLVFNKSMQEEAVKRFSAAGLRNVQINTVHAFAKRYLGVKGNIQAYSNEKIVELFKLYQQNAKNNIIDIQLAHHISQAFEFFCAGNKEKVNELSYPYHLLRSAKSVAFVDKHEELICDCAKDLFIKQSQGNVPISHSFYLKQFQLQKPKLNYDYILFDEAQDASGAMLDVVKSQKGAIKVFVGDTHQQIYAWRFATNAMEQVPFPSFQLTKSFRFGANIAKAANMSLAWKRYLGYSNAIHKIEGVREPTMNTEVHQNAYIGRSNLVCISEAIENELLQGGRSFSINTSGEGLSGVKLILNDLINIDSGNLELVKSGQFKNCVNLDDVKKLAVEIDNQYIITACSLVEKYGKQTLYYLNALEKKSKSAETAESVYLTAHQSKGLEFENVKILNSYAKAVDLFKIYEQDQTLVTPLHEEVNLMYVALTRARDTVDYKDLKLYPQLMDLKSKHGAFKEKAVKPSNQGGAWSNEEERKLLAFYMEGLNIPKLAELHNRTPYAIQKRLEKLGVLFVEENKS